MTAYSLLNPAVARVTVRRPFAHVTVASSTTSFGNITGPDGAVTGNLPYFDNPTGRHLADSGIAAVDVETVVDVVADMNTNRLLGRASPGAGSAEEITPGLGLVLGDEPGSAGYASLPAGGATGYVLTKTSPADYAAAWAASSAAPGPDPVSPGWPVSIQSFGAVGDGVADDTSAIVDALAAGVPLSGQGRTYAVTGNITLSDNCWIEDATFKQLNPAPGPGNRRTLTKTAGSGPIVLKRVKVDRNGTPDQAISGTVITDAGGVWIANIDGLHFEDLEILGDGRGMGMFLDHCSRIRLIRPHIHHVRWSATSDPGIEQVGGVFFAHCSDVMVTEPEIHDMTGSVDSINGGAFEPYTGGDAMAFSGSTDCSVYGGKLYNCGEGSDVSGSFINNNIWFYGTTYADCTAGQKFIHEANNCGSIGCRAYRCSTWGLVVGGTQASTPHPTGPRHLRISSFAAVDTGGLPYHGTTIVPLPIGISVNSGQGGEYAARDVLLTDCTAIDTQVASCTITTASPAVITKAAHGKQVLGLPDTSDRVYFTVGDSSVLPNGLALNTMYYVQSTPTADTFTVALTNGGAAINTSAYPTWTATSYVIGDVRVNSGTTYICQVAHTTLGTFAADLAAGRWVANAGLLNCSMPTMIYGFRVENSLATTAKWSNPVTFGAKTDDWANAVTPGIWTSPTGTPAANAFLVSTTAAIGGPLTWERNLHAKKLFSTARGTMNVVAGANENITAPVESYVTLVMSGTPGPFSIGGFVFTQSDGQHLYIHNRTLQDMTILHESPGTSANYRISSNTGADVVTVGHATAHFIYSGAYNRWIPFSINP